MSDEDDLKDGLGYRLTHFVQRILSINYLEMYLKIVFCRGLYSTKADRWVFISSQVHRKHRELWTQSSKRNDKVSSNQDICMVKFRINTGLYCNFYGQSLAISTAGFLL